MKLYRKYFEILIDFYVDCFITYFLDYDKSQINALLSEYSELYHI